MIYQLKSLAYLNSDSGCDNNGTKLERPFVKDPKEKKIRKNSRQKVKFGPHKKTGRPITTGAGLKKRGRQKTTETPVETPSCHNLRLITPENYIGQQGIRSSDQLSENKFESKLRIARKSYFTY